MGTIIGGVINPLSLTPALWIDFSDASTVTLSGSNITQVNDKSGNGRNFTQGTALNQPTYQTAVQNGLNVARFDGSNDRLRIGTNGLLRNVAGATIYTVHKWDVSPTGSLEIFSIGTNATNNNRWRAICYGNSGVHWIGGRRLDGVADQFLTGSTAISTSAFVIQGAWFDYANTDATTYLNSAVDGSTTTWLTAGNTSDTDSTGAAIGGNHGATPLTQYFDGDIGEVLVYHAAHTAAQRSSVWAYLRNKWGI